MAPSIAESVTKTFVFKWLRCRLTEQVVSGKFHFSDFGVTRDLSNP
jgi:hypothetical protein